MKNTGFALVNEFEGGIYSEEAWNDYQLRVSDIVDELEEIKDLVKSYNTEEANNIVSLYYDLDAIYSFIGEISPYDARNFDLTFDKMNRVRKFLDINLNNNRSDLCMPILKISIWNKDVDIYLIKNEAKELKTFEFISNNNVMRGGVDRESYRYLTSVSRTNEYARAYFELREFICKEGLTGKVIGHYSSNKPIDGFIHSEKTPSNMSNSRYTVIQATSFRKAADSQSNVIKRFKAGDVVNVIDCSDTWWCKIKYQGNIGWVKKRLIDAQ